VTNIDNASLPLGIEAAAERQRDFDQRSTDITAHFGIPTMFVRHLRESNPLYWQMLERRWMSEVFGPLAPFYLLEQQARADRKALRDARRAARREAWAKAETGQETAEQETDAVFGSPSCSPPSCRPARPPLWQRATLALMDVLRGATGPACLLAVAYFAFVWLAHHDFLPHDFLLH